MEIIMKEKITLRINKFNLIKIIFEGYYFYALI